MRKIIFFSLAASVALVLMSNSQCSKKKSRQDSIEAYKRDSIAADAAAKHAESEYYQEEGFVKATVTDNTGLDGCRFLLQLEDGKRLEPVNLDSTFHKDGIKVWLKYQAEKDAMSICMAGEIVRIISIAQRR